MYIPRNPLGYKKLRTWQQANEIFQLTEEFVKTLPKYHPETRQKTMDTTDHMLRSARSVVRNTEEGFSRASTKEYVTFLGFSKGSLHYLKQNAKSEKPFKIYEPMMEKIVNLQGF